MTANKCEKCGGDEMIIRWHKGRYGVNGCGHHAVITSPDEHLHYTCERCLYEWTTPCGAGEEK